MADPQDDALIARARSLAGRLRLAGGTGEPDRLLLVVTPTGLELREPAGPRSRPMRVDFTAGPLARRAGQASLSGDLLVRAMGRRLERRTVVDATAGLGRDAFLLACAGFQITAIERCGVLAALLEDGIERGRAVDKLAEPLSRLEMLHADARDYLAALREHDRPALIYIDTMFPERAKSALVKKEMRMCRLLTGADLDAPDLLAVARRVARDRVVVKRALRSPPMDEAPPSHSLRGTTIRYDVYRGAD